MNLQSTYFQYKLSSQKWLNYEEVLRNNYIIMMPLKFITLIITGNFHCIRRILFSEMYFCITNLQNVRKVFYYNVNLFLVLLFLARLFRRKSRAIVIDFVVVV